MKIRVGNVFYGVQPHAPVMVELTPQDKENIANMLPDATKYAIFPDDWGTPEEMLAWMTAADIELPDDGDE